MCLRKHLDGYLIHETITPSISSSGSSRPRLTPSVSASLLKKGCHGVALVTRLTTTADPSPSWWSLVFLSLMRKYNQLLLCVSSATSGIMWLHRRTKSSIGLLPWRLKNHPNCYGIIKAKSQSSVFNDRAGEIYLIFLECVTFNTASEHIPFHI